MKKIIILIGLITMFSCKKNDCVECRFNYTNVPLNDTIMYNCDGNAEAALQSLYGDDVWDNGTTKSVYGYEGGEMKVKCK